MQSTLLLFMALLTGGQVAAPQSANADQPLPADPQAKFFVPENSPARTAVGRVTPSKADQKARLSYALTSGNEGSVFAVNPKTGRITVKPGAKLDFEARRDYDLEVTISKKTSEEDGLGNDFAEELRKSGIDFGVRNAKSTVIERQSVRVHVTDANEPPVLAEQRLVIVENSRAGAVVGRVSVNDPDADDSIIYLFNDDNDASPFEIDRDTGEITVLDGSLLDFETTARYELNVVALDRAGAATSGTVVLELTNINEPPVIGAQQFQLIENSAAGTLVGRIVGTDPDTSDVLTYQIIQGNEDGCFILDKRNGELSVNDQALLDYEGKPFWSMQILVTDSAGLGQTADVQIALADVNEPPVAGTQSFSMPSEVTHGTIIGQFSATDPDQDDSLSYAITGGNDDGSFAIDPKTGELSVADPEVLNARRERTVDLEITATDRSSDYATAFVHIELGVAAANQSLIAAIVAQQSQEPSAAPAPINSAPTETAAVIPPPVRQPKQGSALWIVGGLSLGMIVWGGLLVFTSLKLRRQAKQQRAALAATKQNRESFQDRLQEINGFCSELRAERDELMATRKLLTHEFEKLKGLLERQSVELESTGCSLQHSDELLQKQLVSTEVSATTPQGTTIPPQKLGDTLQSVRQEFAERQQRLGELKNTLTQRDRELVETCARMDARLEEVLQKTREIEIPDVEIEVSTTTPEQWQARQAEIEALETQFKESNSAVIEQAAEEAPVEEFTPTPELEEPVFADEPSTEFLEEKWAARTELNSLRQVANNSARSAIAKHHRKKILRSNVLLGILTVTALVISAALLTGGLGARLSLATLGWGALGIGGVTAILLALSYIQKP